ncbi:MAG: chlorophyll synthesis pathway protein BchC [Gammaproteobacteria bacterium]
MLQTRAVVFEKPNALVLADLNLTAPDVNDVVVDVDFTGISTGTERLLWTGNMPPFPGLSYPLVPGYETVGRIADAGANARDRIGQRVFVSGADCYDGNVRGLFGGSASRVVVHTDKALALTDAVQEEGTLMALAATALHAISAGGDNAAPDLIVGHGVLGRLLARITMATGHPPPTVWEVDSVRMDGAAGYAVQNPEHDERKDYRNIYDVSGDADILDSLVQRLAPGGEIVLAGFYSQRLSFNFPPAFMREMRMRIAAEWKSADLLNVQQLIESQALSLDGLITHTMPANSARRAYETAFGDPRCLKMIMDWREQT